MTDLMELVGRADEKNTPGHINLVDSDTTEELLDLIAEMAACIREMVEFNVNNTVWIRVTEHGRKVEADHWASFGLSLPEPRVDADGWEARQLWDVMSVFGQALGAGSPVPFETTIRLAPPAPGATHDR